MAMNKEKKKKIWIVVIAIAVLLLIVQPGGIMNTSTNIKNLVAKLTGAGGTTNANLGNPDVDFLSVRLYDKDGNLIKSPETFSAVTAPFPGTKVYGVYFMDYTIMVNNIGTTDLVCDIQSVTPIQFDDIGYCGPGNAQTITHEEKTILAGKKGTWTSNRLSVPGTSTCNLESLPQPIQIAATMSCKYYNGFDYVPISKPAGTFNLKIESETGTADYEVTVSTGGIPTEYCGDGTCQSPLENAGTCARDCSSAGQVAFRTSDLSYVSGSAIAWNGLTDLTAPCRNNLNPLTQYGYVQTICAGALDGGTSCPNTVPLGYAAKFTPLTTPITYPSWASTKGCFYQSTAPTTTVALVFKQATPTAGPCATAGEWGMVVYDSTDPKGYKLKVSNQVVGFDFAKELACTPA